MSSPRKYASPYLVGFPGLPSTGSSATVKSKKKSKNSIPKLSESAAAVKQIQDGIWQTARDTISSKSPSSIGDHTSPRQETSFDDASSCGENAFEHLLEDIKEAGSKELTTSDSVSKENSKAIMKPQGDGAEDGDASTMTSALIESKDSIVLKQNSMKSSVKEDAIGSNEILFGSAVEDEEKEVSQECTPPPPPSPSHVVLKSCLKKPRVYVEKPKKEPNNKKPNKNTVKSKYGRPTKETKDLQSSGPLSRPISKFKGAHANISSLEVRNKFNNNSKSLTTSPRKKSKVAGSEQDKGKNLMVPSVPVPRKVVRFSNRVDVYVVPYEPRAGSRACDWQRNMLEQRVQTFRQLMKEVGSAEDIDLFGNSMLFPGYSPYNHVPSPTFGLRGTNAGPGGSFIGMPGMGGARNHFKM